MKFNKLFLSSALLLTLFSCKKVIEVEETDFIGGDVALQTVGNCEQGVIGAYANMGTEMDILLNSTLSDEVKKSEFYNAATTHEWQYGSTDVGIRDNFTAINPQYRTIDRANRVLQALPKADSTKVGDDALRSRLRGEALFIRAFSHFQLFRYYCGNYDPAELGMPYMETPSLNKQARIKMDVYFQKMNADIAEAKGLLPNNLTDILRATKLAAAGLQARIALYMRDWPNAITYSTEYINGIPLASAANFPGIWTDANASELAFKLKRTTAAGGRIGSLFRGTSASASNIGTITWQPTNKLWDMYDQVNDVRFAVYLKDEPLLTAVSRPSHIIQKYAGTGYATSAENIADAKVFRTAEMYLIRAEARAESGPFTGVNSAESDINALRAARITGYVEVTFGSKDAAIAAVMSERFKELAFEGHRFWDLKRKGLPVERDPAEAPSALGTTLPANNFRFVLPIPDAERQANILMEQNKGYN